MPKAPETSRTLHDTTLENNFPRMDSKIRQIGRFAFAGLPLLALAIWSARLIPQATRTHAGLAHCTAWVIEISRLHAPLVSMHERAFAMHHGASFGVEQASMAEAVDAYWRARRELANRMGLDVDPHMARLDRAMQTYLKQLDQVVLATRAYDAALGGPGIRLASANLSQNLARLSRRFQDASASFSGLERYHQRMLESAIRNMERHDQELEAFAAASIALAIALVFLFFQEQRHKQRSEDAARFAQALLDTAPIGILIWDVEGKIRQSNLGMARMLQRPLAALRGASLSTVFPGALAGRLGEADPEQPVAFNLHRPDGRFAAFEGNVASTAFSGKPFRIAVIRDVSGSVEAERRSHANQRQAELGSHASELARDLERLLNPILLAADLIRSGDASRERLNDLCALLERNGRAASDLVGQLNRISRETEAHAKPAIFELHACAWEAVASLEISAGLNLEVEIPDDACIVRGHRSDVAVAIRALLQRGADVMGSHGTLRIESSQQGPFGVLAISDTADAIPEPLLPQVFSPVFLATSRPDGPDLSGLPAQFQAMGGKITVAREASGRTVFSLFIPLADG